MITRNAFSMTQRLSSVFKNMLKKLRNKFYNKKIEVKICDLDHFSGKISNLKLGLLEIVMGFFFPFCHIF